MNKILNPPNHFVFILWLLVLMFIIFIMITGDRSHVQSAQAITLAIKPCEIIDGEQVEVGNFGVNSSPHICGRVLSEYLPVELDFVLTNKGTGERVYYEVKNIINRDFLIELPRDLEIGEYEFEITDGRRHFGTVVFEVVE